VILAITPIIVTRHIISDGSSISYQYTYTWSQIVIVSEPLPMGNTTYWYWWCRKIWFRYNSI